MTANLDRRIDIQRRATTQSASGAPSDSWSDVQTRIAAGYRPLTGDERNTAPQWQASEQVEFTIRWRADLAALSPKNRIVYPAIMPDLSPEDVITEERVFDIMEVHEVDRRAYIVIRAARLNDRSGI